MERLRIADGVPRLAPAGLNRQWRTEGRDRSGWDQLQSSRRLRPEAETKAQVGAGNIVGPVGQGRWIYCGLDLVVEHAAGRHNGHVAEGRLGGRLGLSPQDRCDSVRPGLEINLFLSAKVG